MKYYVVIHGIHRNPDELKPGMAISGGVGQELPRSFTYFTEKDSDQQAKEEAAAKAFAWQSDNRNPGSQNIVRINQIEVFRMEKVS